MNQSCIGFEKAEIVMVFFFKYSHSLDVWRKATFLQSLFWSAVTTIIHNLSSDSSVWLSNYALSITTEEFATDAINLKNLKRRFSADVVILYIFPVCCDYTFKISKTSGFGRGSGMWNVTSSYTSSVKRKWTQQLVANTVPTIPPFASYIQWNNFLHI